MINPKVLITVIACLVATLSVWAQLPSTDGGFLAVAEISAIYEEFGFEVSGARLEGGRPRTLASRGSTIIEIYGTGHVEEIMVFSVVTSDQTENLIFGVGVLGALGLTTTWGMDWFQEYLPYVVDRVKESGTGVYAKSGFQGDVFVRLEINLTIGIISLEVEPYEVGGNR